MKLFHSPASPYVRKCMVVAHRLGLVDRIERLASKAHPIDRDRTVVAKNPLGKVPTLITDEGAVLFDSRVICEYLNAIGNGTLFPSSAPERWTVATDHALADGILDAALLARYEATMRPETQRSAAWTAGQMEKIGSGLAHFEKKAATLRQRIDIGTIALGCALGYLDFRFTDLDWRATCPGLASWFATFAQDPAMVATTPSA